MTTQELCTLSGDGSAECQRIRDAADRQSDEAAGRLAGRFPGLDVRAAAGRLGLDTPTLFSLSEFDDLTVGVSARIDDLLCRGDLGARRGTIVSAADHHAHQIGPELGTARSTPTAALNLEPYLGWRQLLAGNTLNLNDAQHRIGGAVAALCDDLTVALRSHAQVNVYVSAGDAPGFGAHWDDHDVLVIPVSGAKYWQIEEPHEVGAVKDITPTGGTGRSVWSGVLQAGDALAIPRGWPHLVSGLGEDVSVHLTASVRRPTALDLLAHLPTDLLDGAAHFGELDFEHCLGAWCSILTLAPAFGPIALATVSATGYDGWRLRAVLPGGAVFLNDRCDPDTVALAANNTTLVLDRPLAGVLACLVERSHTVDELVESTGVTRADALRVVDELGSAGLIRWEPDR